MNTLDNYFCELSRREGNPGTELVARWSRKEVKSIRRCFSGAFSRCQFERYPLVVDQTITGQAMGNRLASYFATQIGQQLKLFRIQACPGQGYPDRSLVRVANRRAFPLELKATSQFEPKSNHRMALTCSTRKLRRFFAAPIRHLVITLLHKRKGNRIWITNFRTDFLEPGTKVRVRLEASVSHYLLSKGQHASFWHKKVQ